MNRISLRLGYASALLCALTFLVFTACFVAIAVTNPPFVWTNLSDLVQYAGAYNQFYKYLAQFSMLVFGALYLVLLNSLYDYASDEAKPLARLALCFGIPFVALIGLHYFVQISAVRFGIESGRVQGLEQFVQSNPVSAIAAINMLGWSFFFPLSSLCLAPMFSGSDLARFIRYAFLLNGVVCLLGGIGYVLNLTAVVFWTMNFGMGGAILAATIALAMLFRRLERSNF